jgi:DKNYY family
MKMTSASMYFVFLCFLIFNYKVFGFNIERDLHENESDSLDNEQREVLIKRQYWKDIPKVYSGYTKDSYYVYFMNKKIDGASVTSFQALGSGYAKDSWNAYFMGQKIPSATVSSFQILPNGYAKDNYSVYFMGQKVEGVSPYSFTGN